MKGQNDLKTMINGVDWIKNEGENLYKMLQSCQMTDLGEKLDQLFNYLWK